LATIVLVVVNYQTSDLALNLCRSVAACRATDELGVLIVDNGSGADSARQLRDGLPDSLGADVLACENLGYFGAARRAQEWLLERGLDPDWMILSNADIEIRDPSFFETLACQSTQSGVLAPAINAPGIRADQNPYMVRRPSLARMRAYKWIYGHRVTGTLYELLGHARGRLGGYRERPASPARAIYAPHGSFMIFSRRYWKLPDAFAHEPFLFGEEISVAECARRHGLLVAYEPGLAVHHVGHASVGMWPSVSKLTWLEAATRYCADRYFR
jgi:GT2 family glycosyltransferase